MNNENNNNLFIDDDLIALEEPNDNSNIVLSSIDDSACCNKGCTCPNNTCMETAKEISDESYTEGYIYSPGVVQWFKFTATKSTEYTICTYSSKDTIGSLYENNGDSIIKVDDYESCGKKDFRIVERLMEGVTYYVKVEFKDGDVGNYTLRVSDTILANYVSINKDTIRLVKGNTYELPLSPNYTYKGYNGAKEIPNMSVSINPDNASEQKIWWWEAHNDAFECSYGWDDDGDRYIHIIAKEIGAAKLYARDWKENGEYDECTVNVIGEPVTGISLNYSTKTIGVGDKVKLVAQISPSNAYDKKVYWKSGNTNIVKVNDGEITGIKAGTTTITVKTNNGGFIDSCKVTVVKRSKVIIKKDTNHSNENETYFDITFEDGNVWKNIGCDLSLKENQSNINFQDIDNIEYMKIPEQRYVANDKNEYSAKQLAFIYLCDPHGVEFYLRHYGLTKHSITLAELLRFKDEVFKEIFGCWPRLFKILPDQKILYFNYWESITDSERKDMFSDAEVLFGDHTIFDKLTIAELAIKTINSIVTTLFNKIFNIPEWVGVSIDLTKYLFFNGAIEDTLSSGNSTTLEKYVNGIMEVSTSDKDIKKKFSKSFSALSGIVEAISAICSGLFIPSTDQMRVCKKINSEELRALFAVDDKELALDEIIDFTNN